MPTPEEHEQARQQANTIINVVMGAVCAYLGVNDFLKGETLRGAILVVICLALVGMSLIPYFNSRGE